MYSLLLKLHQLGVYLSVTEEPHRHSYLVADFSDSFWSVCVEEKVDRDQMGLVLLTLKSVGVCHRLQWERDWAKSAELRAV